MAIGSALMGYLVGKLTWPMRLALLVAAFALLMPGARTDIGGFVLFAGVWIYQRYQARKATINPGQG
jgi:TRAP-type uncharacterized transport system fused permease subunit